MVKSSISRGQNLFITWCMCLHVYNTKKKANYLDPCIPKLWEAQLAHLILKTKGAATAFHGLHALFAGHHSAIALIVVAVPHIFTGLPTDMAPSHHRSFIVLAHGDAVATIKNKQSSIPMACTQAVAIVLHATSKFPHILKAFLLQHSTNKLTSA